MKKKVLVAAIAAAMAPAAFAQSSVTVGGTINIMWDSVKATGNTGGDIANGAGASTNNGLKSADRIRDGAGSNIRFTVIEDLGGGNSAFVQVESAVVQNSDTRADLFGNGGFPAATATNGNNLAVWGNRNTGIGIRSKAAGRFLIGVWDVHYHEHYNVDPGWIIGNSAWSTLNLQQNMGSGFATNGGSGALNPAFGGRYGNVIRWDSPVWGGFSMSVAYARPSDGAPPNLATELRDGKKNRAWNFAPRYENGGLTIQYSYLSDKNALTQGTMSFAGTNLGAGGFGTAATTVSAAWKITSNRLGARYKFANGLGIGAIWDQGKVSNTTAGAAAQAAQGAIAIKRTTWSFPVTYETGNHALMATWARAADWRGSIGGVNVGSVASPSINGAAAGTSGTFGSQTGAKQLSLGYMYKLSQRTNVHVGYSKTTNDQLVRYDMFANSSGNAAVGGDPRSVSFGLRHTF